MDFFILFGSSLLSATILPLSSELALLAYLKQGLPATTVILIATVGNTAGAWINWCLGRFLLRFQDRKWFYLKPRHIKQAQAWFRRYGLWSLTLAWVPIIGDPLTFAAGVMRVRWLPFIILVGLSKGLRYWALAWVFAL